MKKWIMLFIAAAILTVGLTKVIHAEDDDECPCGYDEDGYCLPCEE